NDLQEVNSVCLSVYYTSDPAILVSPPRALLGGDYLGCPQVLQPLLSLSLRTYRRPPQSLLDLYTMSLLNTTQPTYGSMVSDTASESGTTFWQHLKQFCNDNMSFSLTLENKGSVARDHLSNERTFLAWIRTSLSLITCGIATTQLMELNKANPKLSKGLGGSFVFLGILFVLFGASRYLSSQTAMTKEKFPLGRTTFAFTTMSVMVVMVAVMMVTMGRG
ncbi:hypothetical protein BC936DRAFT_146396, partial [Jimgerdemannia flammicorona]